MNMKKIMAGVVASVMAVSTMAVAAFADYSVGNDVVTVDGNNNHTIVLVGEAGEGIYSAIGDVTGLSAVKFTVSIDEDLAASAIAGDKWLGFAVGVNSNSTGWKVVEVCFQQDVKPLTLEKVSDGVYSVTFTPADLGLDGDTFFAADDAYAQVIFANYSAADAPNIKVTEAALTGVDAPAAAPAEGDNSANEGDGDATQAPADNGDTSAPTADKNTPDTGVEGVAVVAGLAIVAAGAVVVAKKRK